MAFIEGREGNIFSHKLDKSYCIEDNEFQCKTIGLLECGREKKNILFIDSKLKEHMDHVENYIPLAVYSPSSTDFELIKLQKFLKKISEGSVAISDVIKCKMQHSTN